ncbi:MAG: N-formylglutamate amidohydrolase [Pseudomonadota bacterium]
MPASERETIASRFSPPFRVFEPPLRNTPFVLCSPHSGRDYPSAFLKASRLDAHTLRKSEDCFVDELFEPAARSGAPLLAALFPRAFLDVNREPYELDPRLFREPLPDFANAQSTRVIGGLGTIARIVADGENIYAEPPSLQAALVRIEMLYRPFHDKLAGLIQATLNTFGYAILLDCHSMPSISTAANTPGGRPDLVLGDRFGASCSAMLTAFFKRQLETAGYSVHINRPYAGGHITEHYGRPRRGIHALQIEINRGLYLNERTLEKKVHFLKLQSDLADVCQKAFAEVPGLFERRNAAE